jgi:RNA polymerase sigma factor (sigma-70 family)
LKQPSLTEIETVYRSRGADFFRLALARTGDPDAARDAVQEGFAKAIRARRSYRRSGSLEAWVARCVINAAHDISRTRRHLANSPGGALDRDRAGDVGEVAGAEAALVRAAVSRLPERQRDALFLGFYLDFDYATIAETLGIEIGTVSATLHAARAALAGDLQEVTQ